MAKSGIPGNMTLTKEKLSLNLVGLIMTEKMKDRFVADIQFIKMKAALVSLTIIRGDLAQCYLTTGTALTVQNVTETIRLFKEAYEGLEKVEKHLCKIKFK